ncbi:hypothetical protein K438DRAFT_1558784 [Mycena galopus ATCC 62051]|nr:hypothetical protein K438DRAFT_1558784 [Mycena galopus ATCC 62051]
MNGNSVLAGIYEPWSCCRNTLVKLKVREIASFQRSASKANVTLELPLVTGGSWKKSPRTWMPPNGWTFFLNVLPIRDNLSKRSPSSIDTASRSARTCAKEGTPPTFVDDQDFRPHPSGARLLVLADLASELFRGFDAESYPRERMNRDATNITCGNACYALEEGTGECRKTHP